MPADRITYDDKITQEELDVPDNEQFKSGNANDIKDVINNHADLLDDLDPEVEVLSSIPEINLTSNRIIQVPQTQVENLVWGDTHVSGKMWEIHSDSNGLAVNNNVPNQASGVKDLQGTIDNTSGVRNTFILGYSADQLTSFAVIQSATPSITAAPTILSFIITDANPDEGVITFSVTPTAGTLTGLTLDNDFSDMTLDSILTQVANEWTVQLSRSALESEAGNLNYVSSDIEDTGLFLADGSTTVTNEVASSYDPLTSLVNFAVWDGDLGKNDSVSPYSWTDQKNSYVATASALAKEQDPISITGGWKGNGTDMSFVATDVDMLDDFKDAMLNRSAQIHIVLDPSNDFGIPFGAYQNPAGTAVAVYIDGSDKPTSLGKSNDNTQIVGVADDAIINEKVVLSMAVSDDSGDHQYQVWINGVEVPLEDEPIVATQNSFSDIDGFYFFRVLAGGDVSDSSELFDVIVGSSATTDFTNNMNYLIAKHSL